MRKEVTIHGNMAILKLIKEEIEEERRETIVFRTLKNKAHEIDRMPERIVKKALKPLMKKIEFLKRGKTFRSVECIMDSAKTARLKAINQIKKEDFTLIPVYMGWRMFRIWIPQNQPIIKSIKCRGSDIKER